MKKSSKMKLFTKHTGPKTKKRAKKGFIDNLRCWFLDQKTSKKLIVSFILITVVSALPIGAVGVVNIIQISNNAQNSYKTNMVPLTPLYKIETNFLMISSKIRDVAIDSNTDQFSAINNLENDTLKQLNQYSKYVTGDKEKAFLTKLTEDFLTLETSTQTMNNDFQYGDKTEGYKLLYGDVEKATTDFNKNVNSLYAYKTNLANKGNASNAMSLNIALVIMAGIFLLTAVISTLIGIAMSRIVSRPINKLVGVAEAIAEGNLDVEVDAGHNDEVGILSKSFLKISQSLRQLKKDIDTLINAEIAGQLDVRADTEVHKGAYRGIIDGVNKSLDAITGPLNMAAETIERISQGDIPEKVTEEYNGDFNYLKNNLNTCIDSINLLITDANMLSKAAVAGDLSVRADAGRHNGDYRRIIEGVNSTLNAITAPLNIAADYIDKISSGDIPEKITEQFSGDFSIIKNNLNTCIDAINLLIADANKLSDAAQRGDLSVRADAGQHNGDYRRIIDGVNGTLDAITAPLNKAADYIDKISSGQIPDKITEQYQGDFNIIIMNLNTCIDSINALTEDADMLAQAAEEGNLSVRADLDRHNGKYRQIISGVNNTIDSFIQPVQESLGVLNEMAKGNLDVTVEGDYQGDLAQMKYALNETIRSLSGYIRDISQTLADIAGGDLTVEIHSEFKGDFVQIKDSINNIIVSLNSTLNEIQTSSDEVAAGSSKLSEGSQQLSQGASEQAGAIEQLNESINQIASQTRESAANAGQASEITNMVKADAAGGNEQMQKMLTAMQEIGEASANINKIIKVIDDIAFQTNILALNAAVEAARAGQYGKGFAVVAEEVRNLAGKSADAAKDTTELIEDSIKKTKLGMEIANGTAEALNKIVNGVDQAAELMNSITVSSQAQAAGVTQIGRGIEQISEVVKVNSVTAEETAASSEELSGQSEFLHQKISTFQLKN